MSFAKKYTGVLSTRTDPPFPASRPNLKFKFRVAFVLKKKVSLYKIF